MIGVLPAIQTKLLELAQEKDVPMKGAWYGACREKELDRWNYFVFNKLRTQKSSNKMDYQTFYEIHIVHEDCIPDGYIMKVLETVQKIEGVKLRTTSDPINYDYTFKGGTDVVVEIATITLFHPEKRV